MKPIALGFLVLVFTITACGDTAKEPKKVREARGGVTYGGVFRINEVEGFRSLFPLNITEATAHRIANQVFEGLVKFNQKTLMVEPSLAERWELNQDANSITFHLRKGVLFHDDACFAEGKGREVTARDFQYCFEQLCTYHANNQVFFLFKDRVKGANEYFASTKTGQPLEEGVSGVKVIDDYTLQLDLITPFGGFLNILGQPGCWVFPKEAVEKYGDEVRTKTIGTGPFVMKTVKENEAVILARNANYWRKDEFGNALPYLDRVRFTFEKEKKIELLNFRKGNLDMVFTLPLEMLDEIAGELEDARSGKHPDYDIQTTTAMGIQYYGFQHQLEPFKDVRVRQAFNYAINRDEIVEYALQGDAEPAIYGIVPPVFQKYQSSRLKGYTYSPERAQELLSDAGFPNGEGFPKLTMELNRGGQNNVLIAEVVQKMLQENLGIEVELNEMSMAQYLDNTESGRSLFWREAWIADYPDPETFLNLLLGEHVPLDGDEKAYVNSVRYQNAEYDSVFKEAMMASDQEDRFRLYRLADQIALDDAAILPIYYEEFTRLLAPNVRNFPQNAMEYRDLSEVYFKASAEEQAAKKQVSELR
ncbi:MAG: ABC transporter substrate-binding protein [Salibacteraceae bacterium]